MNVTVIIGRFGIKASNNNYYDTTIRFFYINKDVIHISTEL